MELALWTYEGPPHVGAIRIAASMYDVHLVLHAPQGDTYADLLFTMIERENRRPPVTWTTFQARDLGSSTAEMVINTLEGVCDVMILRCCWWQSRVLVNCCKINRARWRRVLTCRRR